MEVQVEIQPTEDGNFRARAINLGAFEALGKTRDEALDNLTEQLGSQLHMRVASIHHLLECVDLEEEQGGPKLVRLRKITFGFHGGAALSGLNKVVQVAADRYQSAVPLVLTAGILGGAVSVWGLAGPLWIGFLVGFLVMAALLATLHASVA